MTPEERAEVERLKTLLLNCDIYIYGQPKPDEAAIDLHKKIAEALNPKEDE